MLTIVATWGSSLGLRIPKAVAKHLGLREGSRVELELRRDQLVVRRPAGPRTRGRRRFGELVAQMNRRPGHKPVDSRPAVGKEVW